MISVSVVLAAGITVLVVAGQFRTRRIRSRTFLWATLLVARGCVPPGPSRATAISITLLVMALLISAAFGALRGRTMPIWRGPDGTVYRRGDRTTLMLWLATITAKVGMVAAAQVLFAEPVNLDALWLGLGVTVAVQQYVVMRRAAQMPATIRPPSTDSAGGEHGAARRTGGSSVQHVQDVR
jgi:hypothetical protein